MFDLEQSISAWRAQMLAAGITTPVPLDELESHLREDIARRMENGVEPQTAFKAATQKIGGPSMLEEEFSKNHPSWRKKFTPIMIPLFASVFSVGVALSIVCGAGNFGEMTLEQKLSGLAAVASGTLLSWCGWFGFRAFLFLAVKRARGIIVGSACCLIMLWWTAFFFLVLPECNFTIAQLMVAILWGFIAPGGFLVSMTAGLSRAAASRLKTEN